jgi:hypothetical protein
MKECENRLPLRGLRALLWRDVGREGEWVSGKILLCSVFLCVLCGSAVNLQVSREAYRNTD